MANGKSKILMIAALLVLLVGVGLALAQPGSLGGDDDETAQSIDTSTTVDDSNDEPDTTVDDTTDGTPGDTTTDGDATTTGGDTTTTGGDTTTTASMAPSGGDTTGQIDDAETSNTTQPGSSLGSSGTARPSDTADGLAATGGESFLLAGLALGAAGVVARFRRPGTR